MPNSKCLKCLTTTKQTIDELTNALLQSNDHIAIIAQLVNLLDNYRTYNRNDRITIVKTAKRELQHVLENP